MDLYSVALLLSEGGLSQRPTVSYSPTLLQPGVTYQTAHFSGCGFMLPYHFGVVAALKDFDISFEKCTASSGGVMAALAMLGGADLELGVRQCFDLRSEPATIPGSVRAFFAVYRQYFKAFRSNEYQKKRPISELRDRLYVRLGRWTSKGWEVFSVSDFHDEKDLEDAFMSAAYVPFGTSVMPPYFRGKFTLDAALVDVLMGGMEFSKEKTNLWPPENAKYWSHSQPLKLLVVPAALGEKLIDPTGLLVLNGSARPLMDFWASLSVMRQGFIDGYQQTVARIDRAHFVPTHCLKFVQEQIELQKIEERRQQERLTLVHYQQYASQLADDIVDRKSSWKDCDEFIKPSVWLESDPIFGLFLLSLFVAFVIRAYQAYHSPMDEIMLD